MSTGSRYFSIGRSGLRRAPSFLMHNNHQSPNKNQHFNLFLRRSQLLIQRLLLPYHSQPAGLERLPGSDPPDSRLPRRRYHVDYCPHLVGAGRNTLPVHPRRRVPVPHRVGHPTSGADRQTRRPLFRPFHDLCRGLDSDAPECRLAEQQPRGAP